MKLTIKHGYTELTFEFKDAKTMLAFAEDFEKHAEPYKNSEGIEQPNEYKFSFDDE